MSGRPSHRRGKTIEEICGEEKGKELRKWYSQKYSGSGNSNYGGSFHGNRKLASKNARKSRLDRIKKDGYRDINAAINLKNTVGTTEINACEDMNVAIADSVQESTSFRSW